MSTSYQIVTLPNDVERFQEQMGSKFKFWCELPNYGRVLYKEGHKNSGEDWSEVVAAELCTILGLPHADYQLASWMGRAGVISSSLLRESHTLVPGNAVMYGLDATYPIEQRFKVQKHTIEAIFRALDHFDVRLPTEMVEGGIKRADELFLGYLILDAWIGNTDRHHENWAIIRSMDTETLIHQLAPTHDHAASLGCYLTDEERRERLTTKDKNRTISAYASKGRSAIYESEQSLRPMLLLEAVEIATTKLPRASKYWRTILSKVDFGVIEGILEQIPDERISPYGRKFAFRLLEVNRDRLLGR